MCRRHHQDRKGAAKKKRGLQITDVIKAGEGRKVNASQIKINSTNNNSVDGPDAIRDVVYLKRPGRHYQLQA